MKLTTALRTTDDSSEGGSNVANDDDNLSAADSMNEHDDAVTDLTHNSIHSNSSGSNPLSTTGDPSGNNRALREVKEIAERETKRMRCWRFIILLSILLTGAGVCTTVYLFMTDKQESDFDSQFYLYANTIAETATYQFEAAQHAFASLSEEITAFNQMQDADSHFPFVTMGLFESNAHHAREQSGAEVMTFHPIVRNEDRLLWEQYSIEHQHWIKTSHALIAEGEDHEHSDYADMVENEPIAPFIHSHNELGEDVRSSPLQEFYLPSWQSSPPPDDPTFVNFDILSIPHWAALFEAMVAKRSTVLTYVEDVTELAKVSTIIDHGILHHHEGDDDSEHVHQVTFADDSIQPHAVALTPVFKGLFGDEREEVVGVVFSIIPFDQYMTNLLPEGVDSLEVVLWNTCNQTFTFHIQGPDATFIGEEYKSSNGNPHSQRHKVSLNLFEGDLTTEDTKALGYCHYGYDIYPTEEFADSVHDEIPAVAAIVSSVIFVGIACCFFAYDWFVQVRNSKIVDAAAKTNAIVLSLFPEHIRDQLLGTQQEPQAQPSKSHGKAHTPNGVKAYLSNPDALSGKEGATEGGKPSRPIAELFPATTIMFGDIVGFTAWSSVREPAQVFTLLEGIFKAFDQISHRRKVFKVETVGDCYVAVAGLPEPRADHAVVMARFARECMSRMQSVVRHLEVELGPDTAELSMRIGLHSGQVTAGVLRGDRARFQLFGDSVNTAARIENTGRPGRIHLSKETAELLVKGGKEAWLEKRADQVYAKGKGKLETYWLTLSEKSASGKGSNSKRSDNSATRGLEKDDTVDAAKMFTKRLESDKAQNLIRWNVEVLTRMLKQVVASRQLETGRLVRDTSAPKLQIPQNQRPLHEVVEVVTLPKFAKKKCKDADSIVLDEVVSQQLFDFVTYTASLYRDNPFHNFEHASHVTMSVVKLMSRIVAPTENEMTTEELARQQSNDIESVLHDHTYGITSDPLTQFACLFSALIHDADHTGVPNTQLVKEGTRLANYYQSKSVAEQNSVDLAWDLFVNEEFDVLRKTICADEAELRRFRQLVVNSVMATDIMDKELIALRNARWEKAFYGKGLSREEDETVARNRKATIVIEHLIQASDVAHTMQHWHVYKKWNERLFTELYKAFREGRAEKNPVEFWYKGEIGFFDFYIIRTCWLVRPKAEVNCLLAHSYTRQSIIFSLSTALAKKLKDCGVFGVSSDEYLNYAMQNRQEWEVKGLQIVEEYQERLSQ